MGIVFDKIVQEIKLKNPNWQCSDPAIMFDWIAEQWKAGTTFADILEGCKEQWTA